MKEKERKDTKDGTREGREGIHIVIEERAELQRMRSNARTFSVS